MKRRSSVQQCSIVMGMVLALFAIGACASIKPAPEQQEAIEKMAARSAGYALAREEPELAAEVLVYVDLYLAAETWQEAAIQAGMDFLLAEIKDPMTRAMVEDVIGMVKIPEAEKLQFDEARLRNALVGFREGLELACQIA